MNKALNQALGLLRKPGAKLVLEHAHNTATGHAYRIWPCADRVADETAQALLEREDVQPFDSGLLPGHPQSWRLGNWRNLGTD